MRPLDGIVVVSLEQAGAAQFASTRLVPALEPLPAATPSRASFRGVEARMDPVPGAGEHALGLPRSI